jgi:hypothetical protein
MNEIVMLGDKSLMVFLELGEGRVFVFGGWGGRESVVFFLELSVGGFEARIFLVGVVVVAAGETKEVFDDLFVRDQRLVSVLDLRFFFVESVVPVLELGKVVDAGDDCFFLLIGGALGKEEKGSFDVLEGCLGIDWGALGDNC